MDRLTTWFPALALVGVLCAYLAPEWFVAFQPAILPLLGLVMFGMGVTLTLDRFAILLKRPSAFTLGLTLQFTIMPFTAWIVAQALDLPPALLAGMILVGASPGGTASNVICYLAKGDVALSIALTSASTLAAVVMTPLLTWLYLGEQVPVPAWPMLVSIAQVILVPVALGVLVNHLLGRLAGRGGHDPRRWHARVMGVFPLVSVLAIVLIITIIVALNRDQLGQVGLAVGLAVILHNGLGLFLGYWLARLFGQDPRTARTIAIEVGMQNSGLAAALASKFFTPLAALPAAIFSIWHNLSGAALATWWAARATAADTPSQSS